MKKLTDKQKKEIEKYILQFKSPYNDKVRFEWFDNDTVKFFGSVDVSENATFEAPQLTSVGGSVYVRPNATFEAPQLTSVGGYVDVRPNATFEAPQLTSVGGYVYVSENATFEKNKKLKEYVFNNLKEGEIVDNAGKKWINADGIKTVYIQKKKSKGLTIYKTPFVNSGFDYIVTDDKNWAHAGSIREGILDIAFKKADRNKEQYEDLTLDSVITYDEAIIMYRIITGACSGGVRAFLNGNLQITSNKKYTIEEILDLTNGEYGNNTIRKFFEKKGN